MDWSSERKRRPVQDPDYLNEEQLEQYLRTWGVSDETLDRDLDDYLTLEPKAVSIVYAEIDSQLIIADEELRENYPDGIYVVNWLDNISLDYFKLKWADGNIRGAVSSLMRYPGGLHEWLMIAALPMLKEMGISMELVKKYRTKIEQCRFALDKKDIWLSGSHGGSGSGRMHTDLLRTLKNAYIEYRKDMNQDALYILKKNMRSFAKLYYPGNAQKPQELQELIR